MYKIISLQFTSYFRKQFFLSSPVSLHDANLIGPYEDNLQTVSYNTSSPYLFLRIYLRRRLKLFYFCNKLAFWIVGNCSTLFKCSWCAINKGSLLLHWVKNCWSSARYCGFLEILIKEGEDFCFLNTIHHLLKSSQIFFFDV